MSPVPLQLPSPGGVAEGRGGLMFPLQLRGKLDGGFHSPHTFIPLHHETYVFLTLPLMKFSSQ